MSVYRDETMPLIDYYGEKIIDITAEGTIEEINDSAMKAIGKVSGRRSRKNLIPARAHCRARRHAAGEIVGRTLQAVKAAAKPGVSTMDLDLLAEQTIREAGAIPTFLGYGGFTGSIWHVGQ